MRIPIALASTVILGGSLTRALPAPGGLPLRRSVAARNVRGGASAQRPCGSRAALVTSRGRLLAAVTCCFFASQLVCVPAVALRALPSAVREAGGDPGTEVATLFSAGALLKLVADPLFLALSDAVSAKAMFACGTACAGLCVAALGRASSLASVRALVLLLYLSQAALWPGVASMLSAWYAPSERGLPWSLAMAQINAAVMLTATAPLALAAAPPALAARAPDWRGGCAASGLSVAAAAAALFPRLEDAPRTSLLSVTRSLGTASLSILDLVGSWAGGPPHARAVWRRRVLVWGLIGFSNCLLYAVKVGVDCWAGAYFAATLSPTDAAATQSRFSVAWQFGGLLGSGLIGPAADRFFAGARLLPAAACGATVSAALLAVHAAPAGAVATRAAAAAAGGLGVFAGRIMLVLGIRATATLKVGGKAEALLALFEACGSAGAASPLMGALQRHGLEADSLLPVLAAAAAGSALCAAGAALCASVPVSAYRLVEELLVPESVKLEDMFSWDWVDYDGEAKG